MATLEHLDKESISEMSTDEAIELLRQIRLSRRTVKQTTTRVTKTKASKKQKEIPLTPELAAQLLKVLGGQKDD